MYQLLAGSAPFRADSIPKLMDKIMNESHVPICRIRKDVPSCVDDIVNRALAKNPEERPGSALVLEEALAACADSGSWTRQDAEAWWEEHDPEKYGGLPPPLEQPAVDLSGEMEGDDLASEFAALETSGAAQSDALAALLPNTLPRCRTRRGRRVYDRVPPVFSP